MSSLLPGGGRGGRFQLAEPPVVDVGCTPRLLSSLVSSLKSRLGKPKSPRASSAWSASSTTATAFTASATASTTATTASSLMDHAASWGPATYATCRDDTFRDAEAAADAEAWRHVRRRRRRRRTTRRRRGCRRGGEQAAVEMESAAAVAVEVESAAPYEDFRESMVAMVTEKEMYAWEDLNALLHQFLALNSPRHHPLILGAFADLWAPRGGLFCPPSPCLL